MNSPHPSARAARPAMAARTALLRMAEVTQLEVGVAPDSGKVG